MEEQEDHRQLRPYHSQQEKEDMEMIMEENGQEASSSSSMDDSVRSESSSLDMVDDASSLSTSSQSNGALDDLSELMSHLPIKRGLSKFYQGKTQSFTCLARVTSLEDLAKKTGGCVGYGRRMKACNSYGGGLNYKTRSPYTSSPKATISKKSSSSCLRGKMSNHHGSFITIHTSKSPLSCVKI